MKNRLKRPIALLMSLVLLVGMLPTVAFAAPTSGGEALSGVGNLQDYQDHQKAGDSQTSYDYVYYGGLKWRVLDTEAAANGTQEGVLLLSENVLNYGQPWNGYRMYSDRNGNGTSSGSNTMGYNASDVRAYLTGTGDNYTAFQSGRSLDASEVYYTITTYYYYRSQLNDDAIGKGPQPGVTYYVYDKQEYKQETSAALTADTFGQGQYFTEENGVYTRATTYDAGTAYYYDASTYKEWTGSAFTAGTDYFTFHRVTTTPSQAISAVVLGSIYYIGYQTKTNNVVSGNSPSQINLAGDFGFTQAEQKAVLKTTKDAWSGKAGSWNYYGGALQEDTYFLLNAQEANSVEYGLAYMANRVARTAAGSTAAWWLRSAYYYIFPGSVSSAGGFIH